MIEKYKPIYIKYPDDKTRAFVTSNIDLKHAIMKEHKLSGLQLLLILGIIDDYDSNRQTPCKFSYKDIFNKVGYDASSTGKAMKVLLKKKLIKQVEDRSGKAKSMYVPNRNTLHKLLFDFWDILHGKDAPHSQLRNESKDVKRKRKWR